MSPSTLRWSTISCASYTLRGTALTANESTNVSKSVGDPPRAWRVLSGKTPQWTSAFLTSSSASILHSAASGSHITGITLCPPKIFRLLPTQIHCFRTISIFPLRWIFGLKTTASHPNTSIAVSKSRFLPPDFSIGDFSPADGWLLIISSAYSIATSQIS